MDDSLVRLADGSLHTMADARRLYPAFDVTRSWDVPDIPALPDESLEQYLRRIGFSEESLQYTQRSYANATGEAIQHISAQTCVEDWRDTSAGVGDYRILDGYDRLIGALAEGLDVRLNTVVESVAWSDGVRVRTDDGRTYEAEQAVITLPLGVLQAGRVAFAPQLPTDKQAAIDHLRMGPAIKLVYRFAEPVLPDGIMALYSALVPPMWWSPSFGHESSGQVITAFATGDWARDLLASGETGALERGLDTLRRELNRPDLQPLGCHLMNWSADPFTLGGYSVATPGYAGARADLATPLANRLFWAGEATAPNAWAATVHGAYASGRRAAAEMLANRNRKNPNVKVDRRGTA